MLFSNTFLADNITDAFLQLANKIYNNPDFECCPRGFKIKEILGAKIIIKNPRNRIVNVEARKVSMPFMIGEFCYYLSGKNDLNIMQYYSKLMKNFSDDQKTINSSYGWRIGFNEARHPLIKENQFERCFEQLKKDPDSRQCIIHISTPDEFLKPTKDLCCTNTIQYFIRNNKLYSIVQMRSNDLNFGFSGSDIFQFTMLQELMSVKLGVELGEYIHFTNSLHIYEKDFKKIEDCLKEQRKLSIPMPPMTQLELDELPLMLENEKSIRESYKVKYKIKSPIYLKFCEILLEYKRKKIEEEMKDDSNNC